MALQNLMGNLVLDTTVQQTNTLLVGQNSLLSELNKLTDTLNQLMAIQSSSMPIKGSTGGVMIDFAATTSNHVLRPIYTTTRQFHSGIFGIDAIMTPFHYSSMASNGLYSQITIN